LFVHTLLHVNVLINPRMRGLYKEEPGLVNCTNHVIVQ